MRRVMIAVAVIVTVAFGTLTASALDPEVKCGSQKLGIAGKYYACMLKAHSKAAKRGEAPDFTKCDTKFGLKWQKAESKAAGQCPTNGDEATIKCEIADQTDRIADCLEGACLPEPCQLPATGQTSCRDGSGTPCTCGTPGCQGHDGDTQAGATLSYLDNGDGTITDLNTGLMWEKKSLDGGRHDLTNRYYWDETLSPSIWQWISDVNAEGGTGFGGYNDWRIANVKELQSIIDYERVSPAVDPFFNTNCTPGCTVTSCSCTALLNPSGFYWSSTSDAGDPSKAWGADFGIGYVGNGSKGTEYHVRAVRGGL